MTSHPVLITTGRVAEMFAVTPSTVTRWANEGLLEKVVLPSGRFRFRLEDVERLIERSPEGSPVA